MTTTPTLASRAIERLDELLVSDPTTPEQVCEQACIEFGGTVDYGRIERDTTGGLASVESCTLAQYSAGGPLRYVFDDGSTVEMPDPFWREGTDDGTRWAL